jgi:hypothetical protein
MAWPHVSEGRVASSTLSRTWLQVLAARPGVGWDGEGSAMAQRGRRLQSLDSLDFA